MRQQRGRPCPAGADAMGEDAEERCPREMGNAACMTSLDLRNLLAGGERGSILALFGNTVM